MKKYDELTEEQKEKAVNICLTNLLTAIIEGQFVFDDELGNKIEEAFKKAEKKRTPWFSHEYIMDTCSEELKEMALEDAKQVIYSEPTEWVIKGVL